mgnify:CR=1 FL=1
MAASILILSNSDSGLYDFRKEVLLKLLEKGYQVQVSVPDTGHVDKIRALGCEIIPTSFDRRGMNPFQDLKLFGFYLGLLRSRRPEAVFTYIRRTGGQTYTHSLPFQYHGTGNHAGA